MFGVKRMHFEFVCLPDSEDTNCEEIGRDTFFLTLAQYLKVRALYALKMDTVNHL